MANTRHHPILHYLRQVLGTHSGGVSDADLLRRFVEHQDEAAFERLLWRHAAMVLHVCRQVLGDDNAANDAFQATFLVFVRKAGSISRREALGAWLYRVAYHLALKARSRGKMRSATPEELDGLESSMQRDVAELREQKRIISEEVNRLPAKYRAVIVACYYEGKTHEEAAQQLGWPRGTVAGRLARARDLLRRRLLRRGASFSIAAGLTILLGRPAQAGMMGLIDSVIHTARSLAAGQMASAVAAPQVAALAEGVLQTMYWTKTKIVVVVLFLASLGGGGVTLLATQEQEQQQMLNGAQPRVWREPVAGPATAQPIPASAAVDETPEAQPPEEISPDDAAKPDDAAPQARDRARSRLNLKYLALAMHNYNDVYGQLPRAIVDKKGKALLSWRVALLPYIEQQELYRQFKLDEPWDSPHNKKLLSKMPAIYAPPGVKTRRPYSTFYQVFVSASPSADGGMAAGGGGMMGGAGGMMQQQMMKMMQGGAGGPPGAGGPGGGAGAPGGSSTPPPSPYRSKSGGKKGQGAGPGGPMQAGGGAGGGMGPMMGGAAPRREHVTAAFVKGEATRIPNRFLDGTSNTILIIEAGNPVPWTKPEDLHYAEDEPLPELGGLFPDVIYAAFADGAVYTLTKNYNEQQLRYAITANDGMQLDWSKIQVRSRRRGAGGDGASAESWQQKNRILRNELERARRQIRLLKAEQEVDRELAEEDPRITQLKDEHANLQAELKKLREEIDALEKDNKQPRKPSPDNNETRGFIDRLWPSLDTTLVEANIPKAQDAFLKCKEAGDLVSIRALLQGTEEHEKRLSKQLAQLHPNLVIDDEEEARQLNRARERIIQLAAVIRDYLKSPIDEK